MNDAGPVGYVLLGSCMSCVCVCLVFAILMLTNERFKTKVKAFLLAGMM